MAGESKERAVGAYRDGPGTAQERLSLSSIFGAASERRVSEEKRPSIRDSLLTDGNDIKADSNGGAQPDPREIRRKKGGGKISSAAAAAAGATAAASTALSSQNFGLHQWKEYAVLRHGNNRRFVNSQHGREILAETAAAIRAKEVEGLNRELTEMRALVEELHSALRAEQAEKSSLQAKVVALEREVEGMDFVRRRWLKEEASNRTRGSNLERRLAGNTGNLRAFLFGADAKPTSARSITPEASLPATAGGIRPSAARGLSSSRMHGGGGGAATSERSSTGEEDDGETALSTTTAEGNAVRRARETAELERSELRRRHEVEMSAKQSRIEKLKLEIRKLEAERDGLKRAAESQAGLFKDGYAELKVYLEEMKTYRPPPTPPLSSDGPHSVEAGRRWSQETPLTTAHHHGDHHHARSRRHPLEPPAEADDTYTPQPTVEENRVGAVRGRRADKLERRGCRGPTPEARANRGSSRHFAARNGDHAGDEGDGSSSSSTASEGSGTLWVRVTPTDENSSEEDLGSPPSPENAAAPWRGREALLRRYLGCGDGDASETPGGLGNRTGTRTANAEAHLKRSTRTDRSNSPGAARGTDTAGGGAGSNRSPSPDSSGGEGRKAEEVSSDPGGRRHRSDPDSRRPGMKRENRLGRMPVSEQAAKKNVSASGCGVTDLDLDRSRAAEPGAIVAKRT
eukprot:g5426.t1